MHLMIFFFSPWSTVIVWESLMCTDELWDLEHAVGFAENRGLMAHPGFVSLCVEYSVFKVMSSFKVMSLLTLYRAQGAAGEENSSSCWKSKREWLCSGPALGRMWTVEAGQQPAGILHPAKMVGTV